MTAEQPKFPSAAKRGSISRRALLLGSGVAVGALGATAIHAASTTAVGPKATATPSPIPEMAYATGANQAGIATPRVPQQHCLVAVAMFNLAALESTLSRLGEQILKLTSSDGLSAATLSDGPSDLTITVGLGSQVFAETRYPDLAQSVFLPEFKGDATLPAEMLGGDLYLSVNASDPGVLEPALAQLAAVIDGYRELWSDLGFRASSEDDVSRNPFGYHDGIIVPRTKEELAENVWIGDGPLAGGTIGVIRRFALATDRFRDLPVAHRDAVIGRELVTGAPLSGGSRDEGVDLLAKSDVGELLVPLRSHARAAHPSFTGSDLMLRRSYAYRASAQDHGLLFIAFQKDVATFSRTQLRLDETDDLMGFATPTATAAFAILPGFGSHAALGSSLFS